MRSRLPLILLLSAGLLLVGIAVFVFVVGRPEPPPDEVEPPNGPPGIMEPGVDELDDEDPVEITDTEITAREDGEVIWRATFEGEIEIDERGGTARAEKVHWRFEGEGFDDLNLRAPLMEADYAGKMLSFSRGVRIEAENGRLEFEAGSVDYEFDTHKLIGSGDIRMRSGAYVLIGTHLVIDNRTERVRVSNGTLSKER